MEQIAKKRSFKRLKKSMGNEYDAFNSKYAKEYANSSNEFSRSYFVNKYNVSENCHYKLLYDAVALENQRAKVPNAGSSSHLKYARLRRQRYQYIASTYTEKEIEELVKIIVANPKISLEVIATIKGITPITLKFMLHRAIVECYISDSEVMGLYERSMKNSKNPEKTQKSFEKMLEERNSKISELLSK